MPQEKKEEEQIEKREGDNFADIAPAWKANATIMMSAITENIATLRSDPNFLQQAAAINEQLRSGIALQRNQIELLREVNKYLALANKPLGKGKEKLKE